MAKGLRVGVIGDGGWGTALAMVASENGHSVHIWSPFEENTALFNKQRENAFFLPGISLPDSISFTTDRKTIADSDLIIVAVPSQYYRSVLESFRGIIPVNASIVSVSKGLERDSHLRLSQIAESVLGLPDVAALSGPSHAEEVARSVPTAVTVATASGELSSLIQDTLSSRQFRIYTSTDKPGVELGGALKNVIAIAVGVSDGMGFGDNTRAALITRGLAEITRLGTALGAEPTTFAGLSGMGDLIVTCTSQHSRNRAVGERLGRGESIADITASTRQVAEGVWNSVSAQQSARHLGIEVPITDEVCSIIQDGKSPAAAVNSLLSRDTKPE